MDLSKTHIQLVERVYKTLESNIEIVKSNAELGARVAKALATV